MTATTQPLRAGLRGPVFSGLVVGIAQAATPLAFWWLDTATVYALGLAVIAFIYIGFAVADGRWTVLAVETGVASGFLIIAAAAITGTPWLLVVGLAGHGLKDLWQHRTQFVANTTVVASVLSCRRLGGRGNHCRRDRRRRSISMIAGNTTDAPATITH